LAIGLVLAGTGVGGLIWAPATSAAIEHLGFRNSLRLIGGLGPGFLVLFGCINRWEPEMAEALHRQNRDVSRAKQLFMIPNPGWNFIKQRKFLA
jgi:hypothetical protein